MKTISRLAVAISLTLIYGLCELSAQNLSVFTIAHPDDWQLFMNPNAYHRVADPQVKVIFLHITSGDGGRGAGVNQYFKSREEGSLRAIRFLVNTNLDVEGLGTDMNQTTFMANGHPVQRFSYGNTVTFFLRLPDGDLDGSGYPITNHESIQQLFLDSIPSITTIEGDTYTSLADLETTIRLLIESEIDTTASGTIEFNAADTDPTINPGDHSDHLHASHIMQDIASQIGSVNINLYQEYVASARQPNVFGDDLIINAATWGCTASGLSDMKAHSTWDNVHNSWLDNQYFRVIAAPDVLAPSIPTNLQAIAFSGSEIELSWTESTDNGLVEGYNIYRNDTLISNTPLTNYIDSSLFSGVSYSYTVSAYDTSNNISGLSSIATATTLDEILPSTPINLEIIATSATSANLSWTASTDNIGVEGYNIYRDSVLLANTALTIYSDSTILPGIAYSYSVGSLDSTGNLSILSAEANITTIDSISPSTPTNLLAISNTIGSINLNWNASSDNVIVAGYNIYRDDTFIANSVLPMYLDAQLISGNSYVYRVSAFDTQGNESILSDTAQATTLISTDSVPPSTPTNLQSNSQTASTISLSWTASTDNDSVAGYNIYRDNYLFVASTSFTSYTDTLLISGETYYYFISAFDIAGNESIQSDSIRATTIDIIPPTAPTNLFITDVTASSVSLSWTASIDKAGITTYNIYRDSVLVSSIRASSFTDDSLISGTTYSYSIVAIDISGNESVDANITVSTIDIIPPSTPANLIATATSTSTISLNWTASTDNVGVTNYSIYRDGALLTTTSSTSYSNNSLLTGTTYSYNVVSNDASGNQSPISDTASATTLTVDVNLALNRPTNATGSEFGHESSFAVDGINSTDSWWGASPFSQSWVVDLEADYNLNRLVVVNYYDEVRFYQYDIEVSSDSSIWTELIDFNSNTAPATSAGNTFIINNATARYIRVNMNLNTANEGVHIVEFEAYGAPIGSNPSSGDQVAPGIPTNIEAIAVSSTEINLNWTASSDSVGVTGYNIFRNGSLFSSTTLTSFTDSLLLPLTTYNYAVSAFDAANNQSNLSLTSSATTLASTDNVQPSTPGNLQAFANSSSTITLNWTASTDNVGVVGYNVYRNGLLLTNTVLTSFSDNDLAPETTYAYFLSALDIAGNESELSDSAIATTLVQTANLALNRPTSASSYEGGNESSFAVDGVNSASSWWGANPFSQWWQVDLENEYDLSSVVVINYYDGSRYYQYDIEVSSDSIVWTDIVDFNSNTTAATSTGNTFNLSNITARYIRVNMNYNSANAGVHIIEFEAYGTLTPIVTATPTAISITNESLTTTETAPATTQGEFFVSAYPNPIKTGDAITLQLNVPVEGTVQINIYSTNGNIIYNNDFLLFSGSNDIVIDPLEAASGNYIIVATYNGVSETRQIMIE